MARMRTIKPEFCTSEQVVECSTNARLLFVCMWCFCDDGGNHVASFKRIKMEVFPADQFSQSEISEMVEELISAGLIIEYEYENQTYWHVTGWNKHQKIEKPTYRHPKFDESLTKIRRTVVEQSSNGSREVAEPSAPELVMELVMEKKGIKPTNQPLTRTPAQEMLISVFREKRDSLEQRFPDIDLDFAFEKMLQLKRDGPIGADAYVAIMNFMHTEYPRPKGNGNGKHDGSTTKKGKPGIMPPNGPDADWLGGTPFASDA